MPRLVAAQPAACAPVVAAFAAGVEDIEPAQSQPTLAEGARIANPARGRQLLHAMRASYGWGCAVPEAELIATMRELWAQGIYVEPTAALGAAAFRMAVAEGRQLPDGDCVVLVTGNGLKATESISGLLAS
jgi:threonine synthase